MRGELAAVGLFAASLSLSFHLVLILLIDSFVYLLSFLSVALFALTIFS